jgi:type VI protein secretion system component Hcp
MKKRAGILLIFLLMICSHMMAQRILLKIDAITAPDGEEVRALEFKIRAATSWQLGGGVSVGKAKFDSLIIKKTNNTSTNDLFKSILTGKAYPVVMLEYYDASETLYFTITLKNVYVSGFFWLSPECPTCLKLEHQAAFVFKQIETYDVVTGETVRFDIPANDTY